MCIATRHLRGTFSGRKESKMKRVPYLFVLVYLLCTGCASRQCKEDVAFPLKIGLLADSQITSLNGHSDFHYRSKLSDNLIDVAIRPPALECFLSEEMLRIALDKLTQDSDGNKIGVDVILYLGDAANSGGTDEVDTVLAILASYREKTGVPIFIIIGNHDYLGAGNVVSPGIRFAMLNRVGQPENPPMTKYEVLNKFSDFNRKSYAEYANADFCYEDNFSTMKQNKRLDHETGLYLSGVLTYSEEGSKKVQIFLIDSSDYVNAPNWTNIVSWASYGSIGAVSFKDEPDFESQISYFKKHMKGPIPDFRVIASHYPRNDLDRLTYFTKPGEGLSYLTNSIWGIVEGTCNFFTFSESLDQNLKELLLSAKRNYWLSAHTHVKKIPKPDKIVIGGILRDKYFKEINVGSTTDYRAHVAIVEPCKGGNSINGYVSYREIPLFDCDCEEHKKLLAEVVKAIGDYGFEHYNDPKFKDFIKPIDIWAEELHIKKKGVEKADLYWKDTGATVLGLNKEYRKNEWSDEQTKVSCKHLKMFIDEFVKNTESKQDDVISCLGLLAGAYEKGLLPRKCDFSQECLEEICNNP